MGAHRRMLLLMVGIISSSILSSRAWGQSRPAIPMVELGVGAFVPMRDLSRGPSGSTRLEVAPVASAGIVAALAGSAVLRVRGFAGLGGGTTTRYTTGTGSGESSDPGGRFWAGMADVNIGISQHPALEFGAGLGVRRYSFPKGDCAGPCGSGDPSDTSPVGTLNVAVSSRAGRHFIGLEATALVSRYSGRAMYDLLIGLRFRF